MERRPPAKYTRPEEIGLKAEDGPQQGGLAGAVHPDQPVDLPAPTENETWRRTWRPDNDTDSPSTTSAGPLGDRPPPAGMVRSFSRSSQPFRRSPLDQRVPRKASTSASIQDW